MNKVLDLIKFDGRIKASEIRQAFPDESLEDLQDELDDLLERGEIEKHLVEYRTVWYQVAKVKEVVVAKKVIEEEDHEQNILDYIKQWPGISKAGLLDVVASKTVRDSRLANLLAKGLVVVKKEGTKNGYYAVIEEPEVIPVPEIPMDKQVLTFLQEHKFKTWAELLEKFEPEDEEGFKVMILELIEAKKITVDESDDTMFVK